MNRLRVWMASRGDLRLGLRWVQRRVLSIDREMVALRARMQRQDEQLQHVMNAIDATQRALGTLDEPGPLSDAIVQRATVTQSALRNFGVPMPTRTVFDQDAEPERKPPPPMPPEFAESMREAERIMRKERAHWPTIDGKPIA